MTDQRRIATNGIHLNIAEAGEGPLVLLLHGFPESWYSWRHQLEPLASAGYHVVAPDMRGYGKSDKPSETSQYNQVEVIRDVVGLIPALGYEAAVVIGHDWGAPTAWGAAQDFPDKVSAVGALSVPFSPRTEEPPLARMQALFRDRFFYQLYFQTPGVAEAELEKDISVSLRKFLYWASGNVAGPLAPQKSPQSDLLSDLIDPDEFPRWLSDQDLAFYVREFSRDGFRGPLSYYRNHDLTWELTSQRSNIVRQPAMFAAGEKDPVIMLGAQALENMPRHVTDLRINEMIPGIGHWTQQEAPEDVTRIILRFLGLLS
ncbi:MAG: alpha/beta hydrolase [Gammaproteobacteria bacterium]|nr:alpha/beta hydrolase [Gammaproteobacteria bacterium]